MKKFLSLILVCLMIASFAACTPKDADNNPTDGSDIALEIDWQTLADDDVVGAWKPAEGVADEYVLFTPESKLRVVYGTVVFEADITYGKDVKGNKSAYTDGTYLYGQWTYKIDGDVLTVSYPKTNENDETVFEEKIFNRTDYTPITLLAKDDFAVDKALVGTWTNDTYKDSYTFTEDGYAIFAQDLEDGINSYTTEIKHTYTVKDGKINLSYYKSNDDVEITDSHDYTIEGTKLIIGESDYYLNGEGDPAATEVTTATE